MQVGEAMTTLITLDRVRTVEKNGIEIDVNECKCCDCNEVFVLELPSPKFCPYCGNKFTEFEDVSV